MKVFHAARQDIEIFVKQADARPDADLRHPDRRDGVRLRRPGQLRPAGLPDHRRADRQDLALHRLGAAPAHGEADRLCGGGRHLSARCLRSRSRRSSRHRTGTTWVAEEMAVLADVETYRTHPEDAWQRLKMRVKKPRQLAVLQELAAWREREAQSATCRAAACSRTTRSTRSPCSSRATRSSWAGCGRSRAASSARASGRGILAVVESALAIPEAKLPTAPAPAGRSRACQRRCRAPEGAPEDGRGKAWAWRRGSSPIPTIWSASPPTTTPMCRRCRGWRRQLFGEQALALKRGELATGPVAARGSPRRRSTSGTSVAAE